MARRCMAFDPSIRSGHCACAWGILDDKGFHLLETAKVKFPGKDVHARALALATEARKQIVRIQPKHLAVECPDTWTTYRQNAPSIIKLALATAAIAGAGIDVAEVELVSVKRWMAGRRHDRVLWDMQTIFPEKLMNGASDDEIMAAGLCLWLADEVRFRVTGKVRQRTLEDHYGRKRNA